MQLGLKRTYIKSIKTIEVDMTFHVCHAPFMLKKDANRRRATEKRKRDKIAPSPSHAMKTSTL
jgi:hypothetical protein